ncbi:MAG: nuclear transport factor 2 family protein [Streptomycetaceae bacterium]|nr:nuclear transport factor 2 family protein [Streptomycetaceae bacterium]NUU22257.1 nuclear transport factor 2 family protein [Streptomycetaceae bacterium]
MSHDALAVLLDKQAITEVIHGYCRALDRMERDAALGIWHADGTADYPPFFTGTGAGFVDWVWEMHAAMTGHSHQISNILIEVDGDHAVSESYVTVALQSAAGPGRTAETVVRGRYLDRWSRRADRWALDARRHVVDLQTVTLHDAAMTAVEPHDGASARDTADPSYALFR